MYDESGHRGVKTERVPDEERARFSLADDDVLILARGQLRSKSTTRACAARPRRWISSGRKTAEPASSSSFRLAPRRCTAGGRRPRIRMYKLERPGVAVATGLAIGDAIATGRARIVRDPRKEAEIQKGDVLVTEVTDPDWEPIMKIASAIVTDRGGRTSHAAIVARELGIPAIVGTGDATATVGEGRP